MVDDEKEYFNSEQEAKDYCEENGIDPDENIGHYGVVWVVLKTSKVKGPDNKGTLFADQAEKKK